MADGDENAVVGTAQEMPQKTGCRIEGCAGKHLARGLCRIVGCGEPVIRRASRRSPLAPRSPQ